LRPGPNQMAGRIQPVAAARKRLSDLRRLWPPPRQGFTQMGTAATSGNMVGSVTVERLVPLDALDVCTFTG
jgi:hypothetical protein